MLPHTRTWSRRQKWLIIAGCAVVITLVGSGAYIYERDYRGPSDSVFVGTWYMEDGCIDCANYITFQANHKVVGFSDSVGRTYGGRWYAGGQLLVIHYDSAEEAKSIVMRILDIAPDAIRVRSSGREMWLKRSTAVAPQASNQAMERTADRCTLHS
jgi:hypothetical protein